MSTDEYVPSEGDMRHAYWLTRMLDHHTDVDAAFDRFLARVRRDAAREAEARIKAVEDLCDDADKRHASVLIVTKVRRALDA